MTDDRTLRESLQQHYGAAARMAAAGHSVIAQCGDRAATIGSGLYQPDELALLPEGAVAGSIGCANPVALAQLQPGEIVVDLGSGGGIDVLLSAGRVGPQGFVYGLDMTPDMLALARQSQRRAGVTNVEFLEGRIEAIPLPGASVDVIMSNCVIGLSTRKDAVFGEAFRVLRPGGRLAVADVVADDDHDLAPPVDDIELAACLAGAATRGQHRDQLAVAGFVDIAITDSHQVADGLWSVFVRAAKPPEDRAMPGGNAAHAPGVEAIAATCGQHRLDLLAAGTIASGKCSTTGDPWQLPGQDGNP